jgi:hypothetical protein
VDQKLHKNLTLSDSRQKTQLPYQPHNTLHRLTACTTNLIQTLPTANKDKKRNCLTYRIA